MGTFRHDTALVAILSLALAHSCASTTETARRPTYAKDLRQLDRKAIEAAMVELSKDVIALDAMLRSNERAPEEAQAEVVTLLASMETSASALIGSRAFSKHEILQANIEAFRFDLQRARETASREPPNFALASSVSSFCLSCHVRSSDAPP